jgi:hypothetical protein
MPINNPATKREEIQDNLSSSFNAEMVSYTEDTRAVEEGHFEVDQTPLRVPNTNEENISIMLAEKLDEERREFVGSEKSRVSKWFFTLTPDSDENRIHMMNFMDKNAQFMNRAYVGCEGGDEKVPQKHFHSCLWMKDFMNLWRMKNMFENEGFKPTPGKDKIYLNLSQIKSWPKAVNYAIKGSLFVKLEHGRLILPEPGEAKRSGEVGRN